MYVCIQIYQELRNRLFQPWSGDNQGQQTFLAHSADMQTVTMIQRAQVLHEKPYFFPKYSKKMVFPKRFHWNMIFLVSSGKMIFLFPENMILYFRRKINNDLSRRNTWKYDILFKCSEKMVFPKTSR